MTAPVPNAASLAPAANGAGAAAKAGPDTPAAAFDALVAALFAPIDGGQGGQQIATPAAFATVGADSASAAIDEAATLDEASGVDAGNPNPEAALTAFNSVPTILVDEQSATPAAGDATEAPWGQGKAKGAPAGPALAHADAHARLAEKLAGKLTDVEEDADLASPVIETSGRPSAPANGLDPLATRQASTTPAASATPAAPPTVKAAPDALPPTQDVTEAPAPTPPEQAAPPAEAKVAAETQVAPPPPRAANAAARPGRSERARADDAASAKDTLTGVQPAARSPRAPFGGAAITDGAERLPTPEANLADLRSDENPEGFSVGETSAAAAATSAAHVTHGHAVRGSPETVASLAAQILKKLDGRSTRFDVELDPAGLGKVDVRIDIGAQGRISASMMFDNPQTAADLKARAGELRQALEQAGFNLSGGMSFDVAGGQGQAHRDWSGGEGGRSFRSQAFQAALDTASDAAEVALQGALRLRHGVTSQLDLRI